MAQWYAHLVFKGDALLGEGLSDLALVEGVVSPNTPTNGDFAGDNRYTTVIVSGYALYGQLRGYYALGVAQLVVDPASGRAAYLSEASALHKEPASTLTSTQRAAIRNWLMALSASAWENSTELFRQELDAERTEGAQATL
jgi:hypothetical protein